MAGDQIYVQFKNLANYFVEFLDFGLYSIAGLFRWRLFDYNNDILLSDTT